LQRTLELPSFRFRVHEHDDADAIPWPVAHEGRYARVSPVMAEDLVAQPLVIVSLSPKLSPVCPQRRIECTSFRRKRPQVRILSLFSSCPVHGKNHALARTWLGVFTLAGLSRRCSQRYFSCQITVPGQRLPFSVLRHVVAFGLFSVDRIRVLLHSVHVPIHVVAKFATVSSFLTLAWPDVCPAKTLTQTIETQRASPKSKRRMFFSFVRIGFDLSIMTYLQKSYN